MKNLFEKDYKKAIHDLTEYKKWFDYYNHDVTNILSKVMDILNHLHNSDSVILKHFSVSYAGMEDAGVQIWAWQMDKSLPAAMAHYTNIMLIEVWDSTIKITYFDLKPINIYKWWDYKRIKNATNQDIINAIKWVTTTPCNYIDWEQNIPWYRRIINRLHIEFYSLICF
jgi:hypothetical protein